MGVFIKNVLGFSGATASSNMSVVNCADGLWNLASRLRKTTNNPNSLGNTCTGVRGVFGYSIKIPPYGKSENSPCVESKWRTCRTNHCSKWVWIDFYFIKESRKTICIEFRSILVKIPPILKRGHLSSTVELRDHLFCDWFAAAVSRAFRAGTRKLSFSGNSTNI